MGGDPKQGFSLLRLGPGEPHVLREDLAKPVAGREQRRFSIVYFGQITDFQLPDEESPAREEHFDAEPFGRVSTSGFRPQEAMVIHAIELSIRQLNRFVRSPVRQGDGTRVSMLNAVMTGDLADNFQRNETQWVAELLEGSDKYPGGDPFKPNPSVRDPLDPNSGTNDLTGTKCPPGTPLDNPRNYTGVQDYDDYGPDNPLFWDPDLPIGIYAERKFPTFPCLMDKAQVPFQAEGVKVPSYVAFGNHDALYQGTVGATPLISIPQPPFESIAVDCLKLLYPLQDQSSGQRFVTPDQLVQALTSEPGKVTQVPPDRNRQYVDKRQFKDLFRLGAQDDDHGFAYIDAKERADSNDQASYYSFSPKRGLRYIVLDTVSESGALATPSFGPGVTTGAEGNIDHPQWVWLKQELEAAEKRDELTITFGHHNVRTLENALADESAPCGQSKDAHDHDAVNQSCDRDPRNSAPVHSGEELAELLKEHPHVVAHVAGHTHENEILPFPDRRGGFWQITSPAVADWPPQHRVIDVMDNVDGTLSLFGTLLDHEAPPEIPASGSSAGGFGTDVLASIHRAITYNDPQVGPRPDNVGERRDRNAELVIRDPRRNPLRPGGRSRCASLRGTIRGKGVHRARLGRTRRQIRRRYPTRRTHRGLDYFCLADRKHVRVGYPTLRVRRSLGRSLRRRTRGRAVMILASSRAFRVRGVRPGTSLRAFRRRVRGERYVFTRRGTRWYVARGRQATIVFRVRRGQVREVGLADRRLTRTRRAMRILFRGW